ncbi:MAG: FGGY family carbohydrate kinase [Comamonas sp.]|uniref:FGGY-family carbohydrate kinase n=1 Tax=Comamonas sp. TaxID=34028 RepID=UPI002FC9B25D
MRILAFDIGTTNWKAGLYHDGVSEGVARMPTPITAEGTYNPDEAAPALQQLCAQLPLQLRNAVEAVAFTGMAETCLMTKKDGTPLSHALPWSSARGQEAYSQLHARFGDRRAITGLPDNSKYGVYKLMALRAEGLRGHWLGMVEYFAWLLTGKRATDPTLAARTGCYNVFARGWDEGYLLQLGMTAGDFPPVKDSGTAMGLLKRDQAEKLGLPANIPVCIAGHDHLCARYAAGGEGVFCSMGTALVCMGGMVSVSAEALETGLCFGPDAGGDGFVCLGSIQSAGGAVNAAAGWLYHEGGLAEMLGEVRAEQPSRLLFFPFLAGSGAPHLDRLATGAFVGLTEHSTRADMVRGVYAGIAYECRWMLAKAGLLGQGELKICGGLMRHSVLVQTLADVLNMPVRGLVQDEAAMYGAASLSNRQVQGKPFPALGTARVWLPERAAHRAYSGIYEHGYLKLQQCLRDYDHWTEE